MGESGGRCTRDGDEIRTARGPLALAPRASAGHIEPHPLSTPPRKCNVSHQGLGRARLKKGGHCERGEMRDAGGG